MSGWIKLQRKIFNNPMWTERREFSKFEAWIDVLQLVSYTKSNQQYISGQLCKWGRGQYPVSISFLALRWSWSEKKVRTFLKRAEQNGEITLFRASKWTMLTVCKYDDYQGQGQAEGKTEGNQWAVIKEYKELESNISVLVDEWLEYRTRIKKPLKEPTIKTLCKKFTTEGETKTRQIINLSIENGWQGLFWEQYKPENELPPINKQVANIALQVESEMKRLLTKGYTEEQIKKASE